MIQTKIFLILTSIYFNQRVETIEYNFVDGRLVRADGKADPNPPQISQELQELLSNFTQQNDSNTTIRRTTSTQTTQQPQQTQEFPQPIIIPGSEELTTEQILERIRQGDFIPADNENTASTTTTSTSRTVTTELITQPAQTISNNPQVLIEQRVLRQPINTVPSETTQVFRTNRIVQPIPQPRPIVQPIPQRRPFVQPVEEVIETPEYEAIRYQGEFYYRLPKGHSALNNAIIKFRDIEELARDNNQINTINDDSQINWEEVIDQITRTNAQEAEVEEVQQPQVIPVDVSNIRVVEQPVQKIDTNRIDFQKLTEILNQSGIDLPLVEQNQQNNVPQFIPLNQN